MTDRNRETYTRQNSDKQMKEIEKQTDEIYKQKEINRGQRIEIETDTRQNIDEQMIPIEQGCAK